MKELWNLFSSFFRVGLFTFGGGYAMLPMLQREVVERHHWATEEEIMDYYAVSQCTPGIIAVNTATFVGSKERGALGAMASTLGVVAPSILIITLISTLLQTFASNPVVLHAFTGIRVAVCALVLVSVSKLFKKAVKGALGYGIFAASLLLSFLWGVSPVWIVAGLILIAVILAWKEGRAS